MNFPPRSLVPEQDYHVEQLAPGVHLRRLYPGGMAGPNRETYSDLPGGQVWSESLILESEVDERKMIVPDIRMPPNQWFPPHWHDCWTVVVVIEGKCMIGDWYMDTNDVFIAAPSIEYGPLVPGPMGCRLLEIFGDLELSPGGYGPEYRDHITLLGGNHVFKEREGVNVDKKGRFTLPVDGVEGLWKTRLESGWHWDLGNPDDPDRAIVRYTVLGAGEKLPAQTRGDAYGGLVLAGSAEVAGRSIARDDAVMAERGSETPEIVAGKDGLGILEHFRSARER
jgi:hypothetical protein